MLDETNKLTRKHLQWLRACVANAEIFRRCQKKAFFCFIIDKYGKVAGTGYNGLPSGMVDCVDGGCPRALNDVPSGTPYDSGPGLCFSSHAEINALAHGDGDRFHGATLYVNGEPCLTCAKSIASAGIKTIVCLVEEHRVNTATVDDFLAKAKVDLQKLKIGN